MELVQKVNIFFSLRPILFFFLGYPKEFQEETQFQTGGGYPIYARPENGRTYEKNVFIFDNRWVVSFNSFVIKKCRVCRFFQSF